MKSRFSFWIFLAAMVFFYAPLFVLTLYSFNGGRAMTWDGFSLRWYAELFGHSPDLWKSFGNSLVVALGSAFAATVIGTLGSIGLYWYRFRFERALQALTFLPMVIPEIIIGVSLLIFFAGMGLPLSLFTVAVAHTTFCLPFVFLIVTARLQEFDYSIVEAAHDLGASEIQTLMRVIVPVAFPGILSGFLMALTLSLEDFVITFFVSGPGSSTLAVHIFSMIRFGVSPVINAMSVILILGTALLAWFTRNLYKYLLEK